MTGEWLQPFFDACGMATDVMAQDAVAARWTRPSALSGLTTGGLAGHMYAAIRRFEVALDEGAVGAQTVLALPEFYGLTESRSPPSSTPGGTRFSGRMPSDAPRTGHKRWWGGSPSSSTVSASGLLWNGRIA